MRPSLLFLLAAIHSSACASTDPVYSWEQHETARARWEAQRSAIDGYEYELRHTGFVGTPCIAGCRVVVSGERVSVHAMRLQAGGNTRVSEVPLHELSYSITPDVTIEGLFQSVKSRSVEERDASRISVSFDETTGIPVRFVWTMDPEMEDTWVGFEVSGFTTTRAN